MLLKQKLNQVTQHKNFNELLKKILNFSQSVLQSEAATLFLIDREKNELVFQIVNGPKSKELQGKRIKIGKGIVGQTVRSGKALIVNNVKQNPQHEDTFDKRTGFKTTSLLTAPLIINNRVIGVIELVNNQSGKYTVRSKYIAEQLAAQVSSVLEIALLNKRLSSSREFLNVVINSFPGGILIIDEENRIEKINRVAIEILGNIAVEGKILDDVIKDENILDKIYNSEERDEFEVSLQNNGSNTHLCFNISNTSGIGSSGIPKKYRIILISDITDREELEKLKYFQEINSNFLSGISHHLRTPLTSILGLGQVLSKNDELSLNVKKSLKIICNEATKLRDLVDNLIDFAILDRSKTLKIMENVELSKLLKKVIKDLNTNQIILINDNVDTYFSGNTRWLYRAFKQLLKMGIKNEDSIIKLEIKKREENSELRIHGMNVVLSEFSTLNNSPLLKFDDPLTGNNDLTNLNLTLIRSIFEQHKISINIDKNRDLMKLYFNRIRK